MDNEQLIVLHNVKAGQGKGMEVFKASEPKKMLDRIVELCGNDLDAPSKEIASKLMDGRVEEVFPEAGRNESLRCVTMGFSGDSRCMHLYLATMK